MKVGRALPLIFGLMIATPFAAMGLLAILIGVTVIAGADADGAASMWHRLSGLQAIAIGSVALWAAVSLVRAIRDERRADKSAEELPGIGADRAESTVRVAAPRSSRHDHELEGTAWVSRPHTIAYLRPRRGVDPNAPDDRCCDPGELRS